MGPGTSEDAPSHSNRYVADPILAWESALELRRKRRREVLDLERDFLTRSRRRAVLAEGRTQ